MSLLDIIQNGGHAPRLGTRVRINSNARSVAHHGLEGAIKEYEIHVVLDDGTETRVTAASVDVEEDAQPEPLKPYPYSQSKQVFTDRDFHLP